ncbi:MAG: hypothetical protein V2I43_09635 [Parvularcula sp.]|jgi:DNA-directed RNA polymerase specialized sigma24 family protein|nr:hypothetical protein [Parvularcula sp.]
MNPEHIQGTPANLAAVIDGRDRNAHDVFFSDNRLLHYLIRKFAGPNADDDMRAEIHSEVCIQLLRKSPGSYDPSFAPSTFLKFVIQEACRVVRRERFGATFEAATRMCSIDDLEAGLHSNSGLSEEVQLSGFDDTERRIWAIQLLRRMPFELARILVLEHWHGLTFKEACAEVGVERTAAYRKLRAFKAHLN